MIEEAFNLAIDKDNIEMVELLLSLDGDRRISKNTIIKIKSQKLSCVL